jgi:hypothetical protein
MILTANFRQEALEFGTSAALSNINKVADIKAGEMGAACSTHETKAAYIISVAKHEGNRPLGNWQRQA